MNAVLMSVVMLDVMATTHNTEATIKITGMFVTGKFCLVYYTWAWLGAYTKGGSELTFKYPEKNMPWTGEH
jgi:hypothetical protein